MFPFFSHDVLKLYTEPQQLYLLISVIGLMSSQVFASDFVRTYLKGLLIQKAVCKAYMSVYVCFTSWFYHLAALRSR